MMTNAHTMPVTVGMVPRNSSEMGIAQPEYEMFKAMDLAAPMWSMAL